MWHCFAEGVPGAGTEVSMNAAAAATSKAASVTVGFPVVRVGRARYTGPFRMRTLDLGCGYNKYPGSIGVDIAPLKGVDVVADLNALPLPFADDSFDRVRITHVIEHLASITKTLEEVHRISKAGAVVEIVTPHHSDSSSWQDPTHVWHLNTRSFDYFVPGFKTTHYSRARFSVRRSEVKLLKLYKILGFEWLVNASDRHPRLRFIRKFWEQYLCFVVRGKLMEFDLITLKK
jgi:SAM-dependent methyltransferase